jgi:hypothetical protein
MQDFKLTFMKRFLFSAGSFYILSFRDMGDAIRCDDGHPSSFSTPEILSQRGEGYKDIRQCRLLN